MRGRGVLAIRLSLAEKLRIASAAVLRGLGLSTYVRQAALEQAERDLAPKPAPEAESSFSREDSVAGGDSLFRENLGRRMHSASPQEPPPALPDEAHSTDNEKSRLRRIRIPRKSRTTSPPQTLVDLREDEDEQGEPAEWMKERVARGLPDGATWNEWKSGGFPLGGDIRE